VNRTLALTALSKNAGAACLATALAMSSGCGRSSPPPDHQSARALDAASATLAASAAASALPQAANADAAALDAASDATNDALGDASKNANGGRWLLGARGQLVNVLAEPRAGAQKLGYLRAGAVVVRDEKASSEDGCKGGWYGVAPKGYVCVGDLATLDLDDPIVARATRRPDLSAPLPYAYGVAKNSLAPFYTRIPTRAEAARLEADLDGHLKSVPREEAAARADAGPEYDAGVFAGAPPEWLRDGQVVPNVSGLVKSPRALWAGRPKYKEGFAIVASFLSGPGGTAPTGGPDDRRFDLTTDYLLIPHDRLREVRPSLFHGIELGKEQNLPVAFVRLRYRGVKMKTLDGKTTSESLPSRTAVVLTAEKKWIDGVEWWGTDDGGFVRSSDLVRVDPPKSWPAFANKGEKWIDVSIAKQALVAFDGQKAVYVTLVSTGRDGLGDPETSHATVRGVYRIHTKHATITMDSTESGEEFSLRDVPFVQYFETGYALHGAYWHDGFGEPRSHGCINLAEIDASWLFRWTGPELPEAWHGVYARPAKDGTPLWIHP
jgi:lipoprotein-anchoring transpeptidase ErfK/SrfK